MDYAWICTSSTFNCGKCLIGTSLLFHELRLPASFIIPAKEILFIPFILSSFMAKEILFNTSVNVVLLIPVVLLRGHILLIIVLGETYMHQVLVPFE